MQAQGRQVTVPGGGTLPFSLGVKADGLIYIAGTLAQEGDIKAQTKTVLDNIGQTLTKSGSSLANVVAVHVYVKNAADAAGMTEVWRTVWPKDPPVRTTVVGQLVQPNALVEMSAVAVPNGAERVVVTPPGWSTANPYSYAIRTGDTLFMSGIVARNTKDNQPIEGDMATQTKAVMATEPAQVFLDHADTLLPADRWDTCGDLARRLHTEAADIAYIEGRFADIDRHAVPVLAHTSDPLERMPIHNIHIGIGVAQNRWGEATQYAIDVLADEYGIELPYKPSLATVATEIARMRWQLRRWSIDDLRELPPMRDELVDASMSLLMKTATNAYWASPNLVPLIGLTMVRESIRHGNSGLSAYGYVLYGLVASAVLFESELGYRYGELAMEVLDRSGARHLVGKTALVHHGFIRHGVEPMATCGKSVLEGFHEAHAAGDIENAAYCAMAALYTAVVSGESLPVLTERLAPYVDAVRASGHEQTIYGTSVWLQVVDNLIDMAVYTRVFKCPLPGDGVVKPSTSCDVADGIRNAISGVTGAKIKAIARNSITNVIMDMVAE
jgi:enamine deaminase RidA (YjgF/YER057c/UK114 family)